MVRVSVIIPTYNRVGVVERAIDSALGQTLTDLEILVVDDGSTDGTEALVKSYDDERVTLLTHEENRGGSAARNTGIKAASGEYVAFLDSDDEWRPEKLERQLSLLESRGEDWIVAYCDYTAKRSNAVVELVDRLVPRPSGYEGGTELIPRLLARSFDFGGSSTLLVRTDTARRIEGFDERLPRNQDIDFLLRLLREGTIGYVPSELVVRYDSAYTGLEAVISANEILATKYSTQITELENEGWPITDAQRFFEVVQQLKNGHFTAGLRTLPTVTVPTRRDYFVLGYSFWRGIANRLR